MIHAKQISILFIYGAFGIAALWAKEINNHRWHYSVNVLANWLPEVGNDSSSRQVFRSLDHRLSMEVQAWERREVDNLNTMYTNHLQELKGNGIVSHYKHMGYEVLLARIDYYSLQQPKILQTTDQVANSPKDLELEGYLKAPQETIQSDEIRQNKQENNAVAYIFYFYGAQYAYRVASIGPRSALPSERDIQYSVLDSFGFEGHNHWNWGPVSSFFIHQKHREPRTFANWRLGSHNFRTLQRPEEEQVAEEILQREKRILLTTSKQLYPYALKRFYYMNFRQNYEFLKDFAIYLKNTYQKQALKTIEDGKQGLPIYEYLLYDLQTMQLNSKQNTETTATVVLELPGRALAKGEGNIETLALINTILNSQFQNNAIILYSPQYSQLLVGVEEFGVTEEQWLQKYKQNQNNFDQYKGITITWYRNRYLIGELAAQIYIGWARTPLRDLQQWIPLAFPRYVIPGFFP